MQSLFRLLIAFTIVTTAFLWLIVLRGVVSPGDSWSLFGLDGIGTGGDFWIVGLLAVFNGIMLTLAWRGAQPPFHLMLLLWHGFLSIVSTSWLVKRTISPPEEAMSWEPTTWTASALAVLVGAAISFLGLAAIWVSIDLRRGRPRPTGLALFPRRFPGSPVVLLLTLALTILLMRSGTSTSVAGRLGAVAAILQWWLFNTIVLQPAVVKVPADERDSLPELGAARR